MIRWARMPSTRRPTADAAPPAPGVLASLRGGGRPLLLLLLAALVLKLLVAIAALELDALATRPASDALYYLERARGLSGRIADPRADEPFHLPPLYPLVLAAVPGAVDGKLMGVLALQALAGTALLAGTWLLARRRLPRGASFLAVGLTLLYGPLSFYETRLLGDSLATCLLVLMLVAADALADRPGPRGTLVGALIGALTALAALLRPQALLLLPVLALWALRRSRAAAGALLLAAALLLLPSTLHNLRTGGGLQPVSDNGGLNFWIANRDVGAEGSEVQLSGSFDAPGPAFGDIARQPEVARALAESRSGRTLDSAQVSAWFTAQALSDIAARPGLFAQRLLLRARALVESFETDAACFPAVEMHLLAPLALLGLPFGVLLGMALAARLLGGRLAPAPRLPMLAVTGLVLLTALLFFHYSRFRLPVVPLLAIVAASGLPPLLARTAGFARALCAAAALAGVTMISVWPAPHHAPNVANGWTSLGWAELSAAPPGDTERLQRVLQRAQVALLAQPGFPRAERLAARACLLLHRFGEAGEHLDAALATAPGWDEALLDRALLQAIPDPANTRRDREAAAAALPALREAAQSNPALVEGLHQVEKLLAR
jgi:hypothetical protein